MNNKFQLGQKVKVASTASHFMAGKVTKIIDYFPRKEKYQIYVRGDWLNMHLLDPSDLETTEEPESDFSVEISDEEIGPLASISDLQELSKFL
jgi:hypothetical protein